MAVAAIVLLGTLAAAGAARAAAGSGPEAAALAELDGFALGLTEADRFSGVVLMAREGRILFEKAYGRLDAEKDAPATVETRYNLASAGKMFTTVAILQQIAAGRLSLDTKLGAVLKDYPDPAFAGTVTVRHLLTHTAGTGEIALFGEENEANRAHVRSLADMIALRDRWPPDFAPGSNQDYSNYGFVLLGRIVEILSGETYEAYVKRHIFEPAGKTRTGFVDCTERAPDLAVGYANAGGKRQSNCLTQPRRGFPAGGQVSTAADMYRFVRALQTGRLVPPALFAEATKPHRQYMGLGFFATDYGPGIPARDFHWGHGGSTDGACTDVRAYPGTSETIVVLTNRDPPACFPVANFLHEQWSKRAANPR
jgi:CubicO group peptidase (beta-lactamase class C family)